MPATTPLGRLESWPLDRIKPYPRNPRLIPESAVAKVANSLSEYGWRQPIVVDGDGVVIVGHVRLKAATVLRDRGNKEFGKAPVLIAEDLTPQQVRTYRLADNRTHEEASWLDEWLALELKDADMPMELLIASTGFDADEISRLFKDITENAGETVTFRAYDEDIETNHQCPKCGYRWS